MQFGLKVRVGLTLSAIWICIVALTATEYQSGSTTFGIAALPLVVLWGLGWSVSGWLEKRRSAVTSGGAPAGSRLLPALKYASLVLTVVVLGIIGAHVYANFRDAEAAQVDIARLAGEWSVYSALAYVALRLAPGYTRKTPGLLTALVFIVGLNYSSYKQVELLLSARQSLAASTPILLQIQAGRSVSDEEIRSAKVGLLEPFLLAASSSTNRIVNAQARYEKELRASGMEEALTPATLSNEGGRVRSALIITNAERFTNEYLLEVESALKSGKASVKSAVAQMPREFSSILDEYNKKIDEALQQTQEIRDVQRGLLACARDILSLLNAAPGPLKVSAGPQPLLLFQEQDTANSYNALIAHFGELARKEAELNERVLRQRTESIDRLNKSLDTLN